MDFRLSLLTSAALPKEFNRQIWLLEKKLNPCLEKRSFSSARSQYDITVQAMPADPLYIPKDYVILDRRDGAVRSGVVGDFDRYKTASVSDVVDLFLPEAVRALKQIPEKYLNPVDSDSVIECLQSARREYHKEINGVDCSPMQFEFGAINNKSDVEVADDNVQIILQWRDDRPMPADVIAHYSSGGDDDIEEVEALLESESQGRYWVDGHDFGSGIVNIFLYAKDDEAALKRLIELAEGGRLPRDVRIGVPDEGSGRYRPIYPPSSGAFDIL